ncbi:Aldose 1-epimerase, partial [Globisporangium splendens]
MSTNESGIVEITHASGARAQVHLYGATVTAFYTAEEPARNVLFVSDKAALDGSKPIRGGIPLVFPIFGSAPGFPNHGLVRTSTKWTLAQLEPQQQGDANAPTIATFALTSDDATRAVWTADFELIFEVKLFANSLVTALHVRNTSSAEIAFQALLHTYLTVDDVRDGGVQVEGLKGLTYTDKVAGTSGNTEDRAVLTFEKETDSVYANAPSEIVVRIRSSTGKNHVVTIEKSAFLDNDAVSGVQPSDAVVWNPWVDKAKGMSDFGDDEYLRMVCVEPGRVSEQQKLAPGKVYTLQQVIKNAAL